jgi:hypothetical protein
VADVRKFIPIRGDWKEDEIAMSNKLLEMTADYTETLTSAERVGCLLVCAIAQAKRDDVPCELFVEIVKNMWPNIETQTIKMSKGGDA